MICVERVHRLMVAIFIIASIGVLHGYDFYIGTYMLLFVSIMMTIWAITNFCPAVYILGKFLPNCKFGTNK